MKRAKSLQRFWAFLLVFVLVATTLGNDSVTVNAAEVESATEVSSASASDANEKKTVEETSAASSDSDEKAEVPEGTQKSEEGRRMSRKQPPKIMRKVQKAGQRVNPPL